MINIRFQKKNVGGDIANIVFAALGFLMIFLTFTLMEAFILPGVVFACMGIYPFTTSKGVLVDMERKIMYSYTASLWIKFKKKLPIKKFVSIQVTNVTRTGRYQKGYMVYELYLLPDPYLKTQKVLLGDFFTKKECMLAAEELSKASLLPLELKIR